MSSLPKLTMDSVFDREKVEALVGESIDHRFWRGGLSARGAAGRTKDAWFTNTPPSARIEEVFEAAAPAWTWPSVLQVRVPKEVELPAYVQSLCGEPVRTATRPIGMADPVAQAVQYVLHDALLPYAEEKLTRVAIAYRPGLSMVSALTTAIDHARENKLWSASLIDAEDCYGNIRWHILDAIINELHLDENVKVLVKSSYRVPILDAKGNQVPRNGRGIPQGMVLGPMLANLYFTHFDRRVQQKAARQGVRVYRFCDDIALFGRNREAVAMAVAIVEEELQRIGFRVKKGTGKIACLKDPNNLPTWLGITFSKNEAWASSAKLAKKARALVLLRERGELDDAELEARLKDLRGYYELLLHPRRAAEAAAWIANVLDQHCPSPRKEGLDNIRKQLGSRGMQNNPTASAGAHVVGQPVHPGDRDAEADFKLSNTGAMRTPSRAIASAGPQLSDGSPYSQGDEGCSVIDPSSERQSGPLSFPGGDSHGDGRLGSHSWDQLQGDDLSSLSCPPSSTVVSGLRPTDLLNPAFTQGEGSTTIETWTIEVVPTGSHAGEMIFTEGLRHWTESFDAPGARSATEVALEGYRLALTRARAAQLRLCALRVTDMTIDGYVRRNWRIGRPWIRRRWSLLLRLVDELRLSGMLVQLELEARG
jgi:hypothetical protein